MSKIIQYAVITATEDELRRDGIKTLHTKQKVVVESMLFNLKLSIVRSHEGAKSFYIMKGSQLQLIENQQLTIQFN